MKNRWLFWILIAAVLWFIISRFAEVKQMAETLVLGEWRWMLAAAGAQLIYYILFAGLYQAAFATVDIKGRLRDLLPLTFSSLFANVAAPMGGASGTALFMDDAAHRGQSPARTAVGAELALIANFSTFLIILAGGTGYLFIQNDLKFYEILAALILLIITAGHSGLLLLSHSKPKWLRALLGWVQRIINKVAAWRKRPPVLHETWASESAAEFRQAVIAIQAHPNMLLRTLLVALASHLANITCLLFVFLAFHDAVSIGILVAGYAMGILFWIVSPTPQGIGVVEGIMALVFASLQVPVERAAVIAVAFRGVTFWIPLGMGFIMLHRTKTFNQPKEQPDKQDDQKPAVATSHPLGQKETHR